MDKDLFAYLCSYIKDLMFIILISSSYNKNVIARILNLKHICTKYTNFCFKNPKLCNFDAIKTPKRINILLFNN